MTAHAFEIETQVDGAESGGNRYRWRCSCGDVGAWKSRAFQARQGGARHAAMMERE